MSRRYEEWLSLAYGEWHTYLKGKIQTLEDSILQLDEGDPNSHIVAAHLGSEAYFWKKIAEEIQPLGSRIPGFTKPRISPTSFPTGTNNPIPQTWELTKDVELHRWQKEASEAFLSPDVGNGKGVVQAVTGSGKTILALHIIERLYRQEKEQGHSLGVIIVVPTIVMMNQWYDELISGQTNLDSSVVAKLGDSQQSVLGETTRIIIAVVNSISRLCADPVRLRNILRKGPVFLIADEVHRYGSPVHRNIFTQTARPWNYILGISATPERCRFPRSFSSSSRIIFTRLFAVDF